MQIFRICMDAFSQIALFFSIWLLFRSEPSWNKILYWKQFERVWNSKWQNLSPYISIPYSFVIWASLQFISRIYRICCFLLRGSSCSKYAHFLTPHPRKQPVDAIYANFGNIYRLVKSSSRFGMENFLVNLSQHCFGQVGKSPHQLSMKRYYF